MQTPNEATACSEHSQKSLSIEESYNPFDPAFTAEPFPFYARARRESPVFYAKLFGAWIVTRHDDIMTVFKDPETFSSLLTLTPPVPWPPAMMEVLSKGYPMPPGLINSDPPEHNRIRSLFAAAFTPRRIAELEPRIRTIANELVDGFVSAGQVDLVPHFSYALPYAVICELLGIPKADREMVKRLHDEWILSTNPTLPLERLLECGRNIVAYQKYYAAMLEDRKANPRDDLTTAMVNARISGETPFTVPEMILQMMVLLSAGHETTTNLISSLLLLLLQHPEELRALERDPGLLSNILEEALRHSSPNQMFQRTTTRAVVLGGKEIPKGARVLLVFASGNRDSAVFTNPDTFTSHRQNENRHLAFGYGIHYCIGAPLARLEARVALEVLRKRLPGLRLPEGFVPQYASNFFMRGPASLPLVWDAPNARQTLMACNPSGRPLNASPEELERIEELTVRPKK